MATDITSITTQAKSMFGNFSLGSAGKILTYGLLAVVIVGVITFFIYRHLMNKKFNKTITFWRRNPYTHSLYADKNIKAMTVRLDNFGNLGYRLQTPYETRNLLPKLNRILIM